jgi:hypothetical protein
LTQRSAKVIFRFIQICVGLFMQVEQREEQEVPTQHLQPSFLAPDSRGSWGFVALLYAHHVWLFQGPQGKGTGGAMKGGKEIAPHWSTFPAAGFFYFPPLGQEKRAQGKKGGVG